MNRHSLPFIFVETSGFDQQVTDGCATDDPVAAEPAMPSAISGAKNEEAISVRCQMLGNDDDALSAVIATCLYPYDLGLATSARLDPKTGIRAAKFASQLRSFVHV